MKQEEVIKYIGFTVLGYLLIRMIQSKPLFPAQVSGERVVDSVLPWVTMNPILKSVVSAGVKEYIRNQRGDYEPIDAEYERM